MDIEESLQRFGVVPEKAALPQIRALLVHETELERAGLPRSDDLALLCCVQLFSQGEVEDCLLIWEAKRSSFDLYSYLDVELMCGRARGYKELSGDLCRTRSTGCFGLHPRPREQWVLP